MWKLITLSYDLFKLGGLESFAVHQQPPKLILLKTKWALMDVWQARER